MGSPSLVAAFFQTQDVILCRDLSLPQDSECRILEPPAPLVLGILTFNPPPIIGSVQ